MYGFFRQVYLLYPAVGVRFVQAPKLLLHPPASVSTNVVFFQPKIAENILNHLLLKCSSLFKMEENYADDKQKTMRVTHKPDENTILITMEIGGRKRLLNRTPNEKVQNLYTRIAANLKTARNKKTKKVPKLHNVQSVHDEAKVEMVLKDKNGVEISPDRILSDIWENADTFILQNTKYRVIYNLPCVTTLKLPTTAIAGTLLYPYVEFEFASYQNSRFEWFRSTMQEDPNLKMEVDPKSENTALDVDLNEWEFLHNEKTHLLQNDDAGYRFKLTVTPENPDCHDPEDCEESGSMSAYSGVVVQGQDSYLFQSRHEHTKKWCGKESFRVMTYNILAECYATTEYAQSDLFPYCPSNCIDMSYRVQVILKELQGYHSDLIFLQEVDRFVFEEYLVPALSLQNYAGAFGAKRQIKEGVALFYNRSKFKLVSAENIILENSLQRDIENAELLDLVSKNLWFKDRITKRASCVLISVLKSTEHHNRFLVTANTHLYWHPKATHIRLIQTSVVLNILQRVMNDLRETNPEADIKYMFCGDFNACPNTSVLQLILRGHVPSNHVDWYSGGKTEFHNTNLSLSNDLKFISASGIPDYTNYVPGFCECIDYILVNPEHFIVSKVVPPPLHEHVIELSGLPSAKAPSDHIAQVVELAWKNGDP